jgi:UDPglucose 6-dehydrogenase
VDDAYTAAAGADGVMLATEWNQFRQLDLPRLKGVMRGRHFFDWRNVYEPRMMDAAGFAYQSVGRR